MRCRGMHGDRGAAVDEKQAVTWQCQYLALQSPDTVALLEAARLVRRPLLAVARAASCNVAASAASAALHRSAARDAVAAPPHVRNGPSCTTVSYERSRSALARCPQPCTPVMVTSSGTSARVRRRLPAGEIRPRRPESQSQLCLY